MIDYIITDHIKQLSLQLGILVNMFFVKSAEFEYNLYCYAKEDTKCK